MHAASNWAEPYSCGASVTYVYVPLCARLKETVPCRGTAVNGRHGVGEVAAGSGGHLATSATIGPADCRECCPGGATASESWLYPSHTVVAQSAGSVPCKSPSWGFGDGSSAMYVPADEGVQLLRRLRLSCRLPGRLLPLEAAGREAIPARESGEESRPVALDLC